MRRQPDEGGNRITSRTEKEGCHVIWWAISPRYLQLSVVDWMPQEIRIQPLQLPQLCQDPSTYVPTPNYLDTPGFQPGSEVDALASWRVSLAPQKIELGQKARTLAV
jgi:hypothetical protein